MEESKPKKIKLSKGLIIGASIFVLVLAGFYWVAIRPGKIRAKCDSDSKYAAAYNFTLENGYIESKPKSLDNGYSMSKYQAGYADCLRKNGL